MDRGLQMAPDTLSMDGWMGKTEREGERDQTKLFFHPFCTWVLKKSEDCSVQKVSKHYLTLPSILFTSLLF